MLEMNCDGGRIGWRRMRRWGRWHQGGCHEPESNPCNEPEPIQQECNPCHPKPQFNPCNVCPE